MDEFFSPFPRVSPDAEPISLAHERSCEAPLQRLCVCAALLRTESAGGMDIESEYEYTMNGFTRLVARLVFFTSGRDHCNFIMVDQATYRSWVVVQTHYFLVQVGIAGFFALGDGWPAGRQLPVPAEAPGARTDPE